MPEVYRVAVCDDEKLHLDNIAKHTEDILREGGIPFKLHTFGTEKQLFSAIKSMPCSFDLILLDILLKDTTVWMWQSSSAGRLPFFYNICDSHARFCPKRIRGGCAPLYFEAHRGRRTQKRHTSDYHSRSAKGDIIFKAGNRVRRVNAGSLTYIETNGRA